MNQYDRLVDGVAETADLHASTSRFLHNLSAEMRRSDDPEQRAALAQSLDTRHEDIVKCLLANTPMVTGTHDVAVAKKPKEDNPDPHFHVLSTQAGVAAETPKKV